MTVIAVNMVAVCHVCSYNSEQLLRCFSGAGMGGSPERGWADVVGIVASRVAAGGFEG